MKDISFGTALLMLVIFAVFVMVGLFYWWWEANYTSEDKEDFKNKNNDNAI